MVVVVRVPTPVVPVQIPGTTAGWARDKNSSLAFVGFWFLVPPQWLVAESRCIYCTLPTVPTYLTLWSFAFPTLTHPHPEHVCTTEWPVCR